MKKEILFLFVFCFFTNQIFSATYTVINTADSGAGSLRQAITDANASPGADNIFFNIQITDPGFNAITGVWTITIASSLPMVQGGYITIDATAQTTNQGNTNLFGPEIRITQTTTVSYPIILVSPGNTVKGMIIDSFEYGLLIYNNTAFSNTITENYIGVSYDGASSVPNTYGIGIAEYSYGNLISKNIISGNSQAGIAITESSSNSIKGNKIGTDPDGINSIPNLYGIAIQNSSSNQIGGNTIQDNNIISGNTFAGIVIDGLQSIGNIIYGNTIGLDAYGMFSVPNENGILLSGASETNIGGGAVGQGNLISGNTGAAIILNGTGTRLNVIRGNRIGTDASGTLPISNYAGVVAKSNSNSNIIGGSNPGEGNLISANIEMGVYIEASDSNVIIGNLIGTDISGLSTFTAGDTLIQANGVEFNTVAQHNRLGGYTAGERNIISGNRVYGMVYYGNTAYNEVIGNYIGTDITGNYSIPNATGICVDGGSHHNPIINNVLSGNISYGIFVVTNQTFYNEIKGNKIGTNAAGTDSVPNDAGVLIGGGTKYNTIGGDNPEDRNIISGNRYGGIEISDQYTTDNVIKGNYIGTDISGTYAIPNSYGIGLTTRPQKNTIDNNLISGNLEFGLLLFEFADSNVITRNIIGTSIDIQSPLNNGIAGIVIWGGSSGNCIGGQGQGNIIAYHDSLGIYIKDNDSKYNTISENSIFQNNWMGIDLAPEGPNYNDGGDLDTGPNDLMNHPIISHASHAPPSLYFWAYGTIDTQLPEGTIIELFIADENSFARGEGKTFIGRTIADTAGNWMFYGQGAASGDVLTATATDNQGNTSEFCDNFEIITSIDDFSQNDLFTVYPNPAQDYVTVTGNISQIKEIMLFNSTGMFIHTKISNLGNSSLQISLPKNIDAGNYLLNIILISNTTFTKTIIVTH